MKRILMIRFFLLWISLILLSFAFYTNANELNLDFLQGTKLTPSVLASNVQYPTGEYYVDVIVNNESKGRSSLVISKEEENKNSLCFSIEWIKKMNIPLNLSDYQSIFNKNRECYWLSEYKYIHVDFDYAGQVLIFTIPQSYLVDEDRVKQWNYGTTGGNLKYNGNFSKNYRDKLNAYGNIEFNFNFGQWVLDTNANTFYDGLEDNKFTISDLALSTAIGRVKGDLMFGKSSIAGYLFSDFNFYGISLRSNNKMVPSEKQVYSPVINGFANSTSRITVTQSGNIIYSKVVPPGPYQLDDIIPSGNGDLNVNIEDDKGYKSKMLYPITILPTLLRPNEFRYKFAIGKKDNNKKSVTSFSSDNPSFLLGDIEYGFNYTTLNFAAIFNENYLSNGAVITQTLGKAGAVSINGNVSQESHKNKKKQYGNRIGAEYAINIKENSELKMSIQHYNKHYVEFNDYGYDKNQAYCCSKKSRYEVQISQQLDSGSLYLSIWQNQFWNKTDSTSGMSIYFFNTLFDDISINLSGNYSKLDSDYSLSLGVSMPFSIGDVRHYNSNSLGYSRGSGSTLTSGVSAKLSERYNYNLSMQTSEKGKRSVSGTVGYKFDQVQTNVLMSIDNNDMNIAGSFRGGILTTNESGVMFTQENSDTLGIIRVPDIAGVSFNNSMPTNIKGYTVVGLSDYTNNDINIKMDNVPDDVELLSTSYRVVPTKKSIIFHEFNARYISRYILQVKDGNGNILTGGNVITNEGLDAGFITNNGVLIMNMLSKPKIIKINLGDGEVYQCSMAGITPNLNKLQEIICE
ncbi:PefC/AfrB family outer membrane usher protein [Providencia rettgeri]